jgi:hypothetical protein
VDRWIARMVSVGEGLLERFHQGPDRPSLPRIRERALAEGVTARVAMRACRLALQVRTLGPELAEPLTRAHHELLLPIAEPSAKRELAERALDPDMSLEFLRLLVVEQIYDERPARRGRSLAAEVNRLTKYLRSIDPDEAARQIAELPPEEVHELLSSIRKLEAWLDNAIATLRRAQRRDREDEEQT